MPSRPSNQTGQPAYEWLAHELLAKIKDVPIGGRFFAERQIAHKYNLGVMVARAALQRLAQDGYLKRVVSRGTFVAAHEPLKSSSKSRLKIVIFCPINQAMPHGSAVKVIVNSLGRQNHAVEMKDNEQYHDSSFNHAANIIKDSGHQYDGIIWINNFTEKITKIPTALRKLLAKTVFLNPFIYDSAATCILRDNESAVFAMTTHLAEHGYKSIGFVAGQYDRKMYVQERHQGYIAALSAAQIKVQEQFIKTNLTGNNFDDGYNAADQWLKSGPALPRALVCATDFLAHGIMTRLKEQRLRIPEDIAVTGFDNVTQTAPITPTLTTIDQAYTKMGEITCLIILDQINQIIKPGLKIFVPCPLIFRASCGCKENLTERKAT